MRIALLAPSLSARDAVGTDVLEMASALRGAGHEVRLYADNAQGISEGVHAPAGLTGWLRDVQDCVIYHASIGWPRGEALLAQTRARRVLRYHNITPAEFFIGYSRDHVRTCAAGRAGLPRLVALGFDLALACSRYNLDELVAHGFPAARGRVLAPLHRIDALLDQPADAGVLDRYNDGRCNVLMLGRVAPNKGHVALIDAFACYLREGESDARLLIVGKQDRRLAAYVRRLQAHAAAYGISEQIHFLDNVDEAKLKACWLVADALMLLSEHEGFCVPLVEAMALGVPIIARATSAVPDTLADAGLLWESTDPRLYAASLNRLRRDPAVAQQLLQAGRERYRQHFRREVLASELCGAIERVSAGLDPLNATAAAIASPPLRATGSTVSARRRIAIVVQRCHADVVGGSEALAWQYAQLLCDDFEVDILSSCALDYQTWNNVLPAGVEQRVGIAIRRFPTAFPRGVYFNQLHRRLLADHAASSGGPGDPRLTWRHALAEEFIRVQGPWCPQLVEHLAQRHRDYHKVLFCTYLYPTTYFGMQQTPASKRVLIPTLHDEPPAYLTAFAAMARDSAIVWLTEAERAFGRRLWNTEQGNVVGMGVDLSAATQPARGAVPYLLYCGRIDASKGCAELLTAFAGLREQRREPVKLVLTGADHLGLPTRDGIEFLGFVDERRKRELMAGAAAFVMPSPYESFSIVTLEAMAQGAPVIVNADCEVLAEHQSRSRAGIAYRGIAGLADAMRQALDLGGAERAQMAARGREYVQGNYALAAVRARLLAALD